LACRNRVGSFNGSGETGLSMCLSSLGVILKIGRPDRLVRGRGDVPLHTPVSQVEETNPSIDRGTKKSLALSRGIG